MICTHQYTMENFNSLKVLDFKNHRHLKFINSKLSQFWSRSIYDWPHSFSRSETKFYVKTKRIEMSLLILCHSSLNVLFNWKTTIVSHFKFYRSKRYVMTRRCKQHSYQANPPLSTPYINSRFCKTMLHHIHFSINLMEFYCCVPPCAVRW